MEVLVESLKNNIERVNLVNLFNIADAFHYLPRNFNNELFEEVMRRITVALDEFYVSRTIRFLRTLAWKRLRRSAYQDLLESLKRKLASESVLVDSLIFTLRIDLAMIECRPFLIEQAKKHLKRIAAAHTGERMDMSLFNQFSHLLNFLIY